MLISTKFVAPIVLSATLIASASSTGASAAVSFDPALASRPAAGASVDKVWWRGRGWGWRGGWGYRGYGWRGGWGPGWRGYGWRGGCYWHPRACW